MLKGQLALADGLQSDILDAISKYEGSVPVALVLGILDLVKVQIIDSAFEYVEDDE